MEKIAFPLEPGMRGPAVGNLQDALQLLLDRAAILASEPDLRAELTDALQPERAEAMYLDTTKRLVSTFQEERRLKVHGIVDQRCADALNAVLRAWGEISAGASARSYYVSGQVRREDGLAMRGTQVRALHDSDARPVRLGEDVTDAQGAYTVRYETLPDDQRLRLRVEALDADGRPVGSSRVIVDPRPVESVDLSVPAAGVPLARRRVEGRVLLDDGRPAEQLRLRFYRRDFDEALRIGETKILAGGWYGFGFDPALVPGGLEIHAVSGDDVETVLNHPVNDFGDQPVLTLNLVAPASLQPLDVEFRRLTSDLKPLVGDLTKLAGTTETADRPMLSILNRHTGWDARLIALAANGQRLSVDGDVSLSAEELYGLLRAGLPADKLMLAQVGADVAKTALTTARDAGVVQVDEAQLAQFPGRFTAFANKVRLGVQAPGSRSTYAELLEASGVDADAQSAFVAVYLDHRGTPEQLWEKAAGTLTGPQIRTLKLHGKLAFLAANSATLTERLRNALGIDDPARLVDMGLYEASRWVAEIDAAAGIPSERSAGLTDVDRERLDAMVPPTFVGETVEARRDLWAEDMARKVRLSYPTQVVADLLDADNGLRAAHSTGTAKLLKESAGQGFRLGETPVEPFLDAHPGVQGDMSDAEYDTARQEMKTLQRVYQITPTNAAMTTLMRLGLTSAYDVVSLPEARFLERYATEFESVAVARLVHRKATQVTSITYNLFAIARNLEGGSPVQAVSGTQAQYGEAKGRLREVLKHYPTMESLFGSMDAPECEHCQSVLSPAAYFVDLLQFIDVEPTDWASFLARWEDRHNHRPYPNPPPYDVLVGRRPDLPHLALDCANTETTLPYIDLVNEILEYYVANRKLDAAAVHNTGEAETAELLAEPQYVIDTAYERLDEARYPLTLPFDLWLASAREFCDHFERPLAHVLEVLRPGDALVAPKQRYDRRSIFLESLGVSPAEWTILTDAAPLTDRRWYDLYGFWRDRPTIQGPAKNVGNATLALADTDANRVSAGDPCTYLDTSADALATETRTVAAVGPPGSGGAGLTAVTFTGVWATPPEPGDLLVLDTPRALRSAKALARRLGLTYQELVDVVRAEFVNPQLSRLGVLQKLGVGIHNVTYCRDAQNQTLYAQNKDLIDKDRADLPPDDQTRFDALTQSQWHTLREVHAFEVQLRAFRARFNVTAAELDAALQAIPLDEILVLADPDAGGDFDLTTLRYASGRAADDIAFLRINLFVRLWRRVGWPLEDVDRGLCTFMPRHARFDRANLAKQPLATALVYLAHLEALHAKFPEVPRTALLTLWSDLPTTGRKPLYASLFLTPGVRRADGAFDDPLGNYLSSPGQKIEDHLPVLQGALNLTADEIDLILRGVGKPLKAAPLTLPYVSALYRYQMLARAMHRSVRDLITLKELSGIDPFTALHPDPLTRIEHDHPFGRTLAFVELAELVDGSGIDLEDLNHLLRNRFAPGREGVHPADSLDLLRTLAGGVRAIRAAHAVPVDPGAMTDDVFAQELGQVLPPDVVQRFLAMLNGTVETTVAMSGVAADDQLRPDMFPNAPAIGDVTYNAARQEQKLTYRGVLFDTEKAELLAAVRSDVLEGLLGDVQHAVRSFFDTHLRRRATDAEPGGGFLEPADFELLFAPTPDGLTQAQQQDRIRARRTKLAEAFLPYLSGRLVRQFVVSTLTAHTAADPALVESLVVDPALLGRTEPLADLLAAVAGVGVSATFFPSPDGNGVPLGTATLLDVNLADRPAGTNSARIEGYLEVPVPGAYRFGVVLDRAGASAQLRFAHLPGATLNGTATADGDEVGDRPAEFADLAAGTLHRFTLDLSNLAGGGARMLVQGETLPRGSAGQLALTPSAAIDAGEGAVTVLAKALRLLQGLGISEPEARYLLTHPDDFDGVPLDGLARSNPTSAEVTTLFTHVSRLMGYARLKRDLGGADLIAVFAAGKAGDSTGVFSRLARLTARDEAVVKATAKELTLAAAGFADERPLRRLWAALDLVAQFGVPVAAIAEWGAIVNLAATPEQCRGVAGALKESIRARFDPASWQRIVQPINDRLRRRRRDALVAHVSHQHGFTSTEQLYEYLLIDPGMEPVVRTSRIRLASSSVQLFVQRCLLNLEPRVHPSAIINAGQWEWMKRYRVWEANRRIFLYPENWLEPEFRDDKTPLYTELEGALLKDDVTSDLVDDAFATYLRKLEELARLNIVAMHLESGDTPANNVLHVFGRTHSAPYKYFYRRLADRVWTAWEPVGTEIEGDHLAPVIWRDRLYLFWLTFLVRAGDPAPAADPAPATSDAAGNKVADLTVGQTVTAFGKLTANRKVDIRLHWSEYADGEWMAHESAGASALMTCDVLATFDPSAVFVHVSTAAGGIGIHLGEPIGRAFVLASRNSTPSHADGGQVPANPFSANTAGVTGYEGTGAFKVTFTPRITTTTDTPPVQPTQTADILHRGDHFTLLPCNNTITLGAKGLAADAKEPTDVEAAITRGLAEIATLMKPVFYQDHLHTFYVEPTVEERTVEKWEEWVTYTPRPDTGSTGTGGPGGPPWLKEIVVIPQIPKKKLKVDPSDPIAAALIDARSRFTLKGNADWLVNEGTVVLFAGELIGKAGKDAVILTPTTRPAAGTILNVNPGSGLVTGRTVVKGTDGLQPIGGGLNIVGDAGFNATLAQNLDTLHLNGKKR
ncbi:neuraminidase-like domain-containing protein [Actinacidiphila glaucinigra]|uniref:neuraminidase-like domain-containing protein n=1 Tax=Actinacidiphila glaucinigra TaxID=235986 RepID=UPI0035E30290